MKWWGWVDRWAQTWLSRKPVIRRCPQASTLGGLPGTAAACHSVVCLKYYHDFRKATSSWLFRDLPIHRIRWYRDAALWKILRLLITSCSLRKFGTLTHLRHLRCCHADKTNQRLWNTKQMSVAIICFVESRTQARKSWIIQRRRTTPHTCIDRYTKYFVYCMCN